MVTTERRKHPRLGLSRPARVHGHDRDGQWDEMATCQNASLTGALLGFKHRVRVGQVLHVSLPLPATFRRYDVAEYNYKVYVLVRSVNPPDQAGVLFLGKNPLKGYLKNEDGFYLLPPKPVAAKDRRRARRATGTFYFILKRIESGSSESPQEEAVVAEDLSATGARVKTALVLSEGEYVQIEEPGGKFRTTAEVRNVRPAEDGTAQVSLMFLTGGSTHSA